MLKELSPRELEAYRKRQEQMLDDVTDNVKVALADVYRDFIARFKGTLSSASKSQTVELSEAMATMNDLTTYLQEAGLDDLINGYGAQFDRITQGSLEYFTAFDVAPDLTGLDEDVLNAVILRHENKILASVGRELIDPLEQALIASTVGNRPRDAIVAEIFEIAEGLTYRQTETLVDTTYRQFHRFVREEKAKDLDLEYYTYVGPLDDKTRDACEFLMKGGRGDGSFWTKEEFTADLHPDLVDNPVIAGGGYNCRHEAYPVTAEFARENGVGADG